MKRPMTEARRTSEPKAVVADPLGGQTAFLWAVGQFCVASVMMMLGNKMVVDYLPLPCTIVVIQAMGTLVLLGFCRGQLAPFSLEIAKQWLPIAALFTAMLFTSLQSFVYVSVSTVLIFRNVGAIVTTAVEYFVRGVTVNTKIVLSEFLIVLGAVIFGWHTTSFSWAGFMWIMINVVFQVAYGVLVKFMMDKHPHFADMTKFTMSMYNNSLAIPMVSLVLMVQGEQAVMGAKLAAVTPVGWVMVCVTCFFGFLISTSGFGLQKLVSATTFLVINNLTKFLNILLGMMFLNDKLVGVMDTTGCLLALLAGAWYSYEMMQLNERKRLQKEQGN